MFKEIAELFFAFAKVGAMTFGGGYAMLPILQREIVENRGWATEEELSDYFAIGQCTPGVIAVNTATFIGRKRRGVVGAVAATLGVVFPSLVIISLLAGVITRFSELAWVKDAFAGVRVCVCVLIGSSVVKLGKKSVIDAWTAGIFVLVAAGAIFLGASPVALVLFAGACGVVLRVLCGVKPGKAGDGK
ncbi:MAG: chromate transporter [Oscillospiraceae bacterium]|nr:chromate transporter [Oscillospiraceae bacterium]